MPSGPAPQGLRIGDRERQEAVVLLGEHWGAGRLDAAEFDDRTKSALRARTRQELAMVFHDLPAGLRQDGPSLQGRRAVPVLVLLAGAIGGAGVMITAIGAAAEPLLGCH